MPRVSINKMTGTYRGFAIFLVAAAIIARSHFAEAREKIIVLALELNDITSLPNTPAEMARTTSIKPLLERVISANKDYEVIPFDPKEQQLANAGFGYLFRFPDEAAKLGKKLGADWIIVGQHSKPSFLESSLIVNVVKVNTSRQVTEVVVDLKGNHAKVSERASKEIANKIIAALSVRRGNSLPN
jgi:hypothetical protein